MWFKANGYKNERRIHVCCCGKTKTIVQLCRAEAEIHIYKVQTVTPRFVLLYINTIVPLYKNGSLISFKIVTPAIQGHRVEGSKNLLSSKSYIFHPFQALNCRARCADSKKVSYVGVGPRKVGLKRAKLPLASAK